jgi:hypothetical protein
MKFRTLAALAAVALVSLTTSAFAAEHPKWSIGGNAGIGFYSNGELNDSLEAHGLEKVKEGWEFGGSIRSGMGPKNSIELEVLSMNGKSTTDIVGGGHVDVHTKALATTINYLIGVSQNDKYDFNVLIGAGPMFDTKVTTEAVSASESLTGESASKTAFLGQGGFEGDYFMSPKFAISARALGRYAKASNIDADKNNPSNGQVDVNLSGFALSLGLRAYFGGGAK